MNTIIAFPPLALAPAHFERSLIMISNVYAPHGTITLLVPSQDLASYAKRTSALNLSLECVTQLQAGITPANFIAVKGVDGSMPEWQAPAGTSKIFSLGKDGSLYLTNTWIDHSIDPFVDHHVFNRCMPPHSQPLFSFAPYTYLYRFPGIGQYNAFGHRIAQDHLALASRDPSHKLIAVFGGSACWSIFCYDHEVFTHLLEEKLNADAKSRSTGQRFTVLNFGLPGNVVLNEMITYMLHCQLLSPDVVIGHDGFNDMFYGIAADPKLLRGHAINYQFNMEEWAHIIQKDWYASASQLVPYKNKEHLMQPEWPLKVHNLPQDVLSAYFTRKSQFRSIAEKQGAKFIWGVQPYLHSKKDHSPEEQKYLADLSHDTTVRDVYRRIPFLYEKMKLMQEHYAGDSLVDFDTVFAPSTSDETVFADYCHLTPAGDAILADTYFQHITTRNLIRGAA